MHTWILLHLPQAATLAESTQKFRLSSVYRYFVCTGFVKFAQVMLGLHINVCIAYFQELRSLFKLCVVFRTNNTSTGSVLVHTQFDGHAMR